MNIKKFSSLCNLSSYTIRYYEKIGILNNIKRNVSGHRIFTIENVAWINFACNLKKCGMPLSEIKSYALLLKMGECTIVDRKDILIRHAKKLKSNICEDQIHLNNIYKKIDLYLTKIKS